MSAITPLANGTYYISCQASSTYVTLDSPLEGATVTAWAFDGGPHQQWILTNNSTGQYFIKNVLYETYISTGSSPQLVGNSTPAPWIIQNYKNGFFIGVPAIQAQRPYVFNLDGSVDLFNNATPVFSWPFGFSAGPSDNELWFFNSTASGKTGNGNAWR